MIFSDKQVVVTGGTGALGSAVVTALLDAGATVHVPAFEAAPVYTAHPSLHVTAGVDLTDEAAVTQFYGGISGALWASIHVAGGFAMAPLLETKLSDWQRMMTMNATTAFLCCREAVRAMDAGGRIVNVAAKPALHPVGGMVSYSVSKAAVASLTVSLAEELADQGIWVNAIVPSIMATEANRAGMPDADHDRWPSVAEVAETTVFLASPANAVTRGALVPVYGRS